MLPQKNRLTRQEFLQTKTTGKTHLFPHFSIIVIYPSPNLPKFSIVTSTKFHKSAVVRNKFRRHIYPALITHCSNCWLILYPKSSMLKLTHDQIDSLFNSLLSSLFIPPVGT